MSNPTELQLNLLKEMCDDARTREGEEWGDERLVEAQTTLEQSVIDILGTEIWSDWCDDAEGFRMDEDEIIDWIENVIHEKRNLITTGKRRMSYDDLVNWLSDNHYEVFCQWDTFIDEQENEDE